MAAGLGVKSSFRVTERDETSDERRETQETGRTGHGVDDDSTNASDVTTRGRERTRTHTERSERKHTIQLRLRSGDDAVLGRA